MISRRRLSFFVLNSQIAQPMPCKAGHSANLCSQCFLLVIGVIMNTSSSSHIPDCAPVTDACASDDDDAAPLTCGLRPAAELDEACSPDAADRILASS